ncbi:MAG: MurR/RpiR family transcriptional regulator [Aridibacter famidurans]|nr:MurR/RpiR family transcriptional regulator [Aridibacter famidurans]
MNKKERIGRNSADGHEDGTAQPSSPETPVIADGANGKRAEFNSPNSTRLASRFLKMQDSLSGSRRKLLRQILDEADETYYLSSREMSERYDVHAATIIRTVQALGYEKFADFAQDLREHFVTQITPYSSMRAAERTHLSVTDRIILSVDKDVENVNKLRAGLDPDMIADLANRINASRTVVVIGIDFAASLANSLAYGLVRLGYSAEAPTGSSGVVQNRLKIMTPDDLLIAISFGRGLRETIEAVKSASRRKIPTFGITNGDATPVAKYCDTYLVATIARTSFLDSYVAPVAAINAILVASAHCQSERSLRYLRESEEEYAASSRWYSDTQ